MGDDTEHAGSSPPPTTSRLGLGDTRRYRVLSRGRTRDQTRDRFGRRRRQVPIEELIGHVIQEHGLTDEIRQRCVCLYWPEIAGERIAAKTAPVFFVESVLHVSVITSSWVHEMQFHRASLIEKINTWIDEQRLLRGPVPLVSDIRFVLDSQRREPLVDREHARRIRSRHLQRIRPPAVVVPPIVSEADRASILEETKVVEDDALRAIIERVRVTWNR